MKKPVVENLKTKLETSRRRAKTLKNRIDYRQGSIGSLAYDAAEYEALTDLILIAEWYNQERRSR
jgi:hypothetical protein